MSRAKRSRSGTEEEPPRKLMPASEVRKLMGVFQTQTQKDTKRLAEILLNQVASELPEAVQEGVAAFHFSPIYVQRLAEKHKLGYDRGFLADPECWIAAKKAGYLVETDHDYVQVYCTGRNEGTYRLK